MRKLFAIFSLLAVVAAYSGCQDHRNDKQQQEEYTDGQAPNQIDKGFDGREMGGGNAN